MAREIIQEAGHGAPWEEILQSFNPNFLTIAYYTFYHLASSYISKLSSSFLPCIYIAWLIKFFSFVGPLYFKFLLSQLDLTHILLFISECKFNTHYSLSYSFTYFPIACIICVFNIPYYIISTDHSLFSQLLATSGENLQCVKVAQSCLTLCDPRDHTVHGILQARLLEWVAFPFSRGSSQLRDQTQVFRTAGGFFTSCTTRKA